MQVMVVAASLKSNAVAVCIVESSSMQQYSARKCIKSPVLVISYQDTCLPLWSKWRNPGIDDMAAECERCSAPNQIVTHL